MLRSDQVKDNTAALIHVPFSVFFEYQCEFHSSYLTALFSFQLVVLTMGSSVFLPWKINHIEDNRLERCGRCPITTRELNTQSELISAGSRSFRAEAAAMPHLYLKKNQQKKQQKKNLQRFKQGRTHTCMLTPQLTTHTQHHHLLLTEWLCELLQ